MALSQFPVVMPRAVAAIVAAAASLRYLRDTSGDLTWLALETAQDSLRPAYGASLEALVEGAKAPEAAGVFMASIGGPATLVEFQGKLESFVGAAEAWNAFLEGYLAALPQSCLVGLVRRDLNGINGTWHIERPGFIPSAEAAALRASPELAALITSFEAVGA
ncbi:hypothetical protein ACTTAI_19110 [Rhodobacter capsulatus]|uniref:hypothetical protein n=1 Tax=Rhodobacter capsulatus TaxID=1061 RepID=UPI0040287A38